MKKYFSIILVALATILFNSCDSDEVFSLDQEGDGPTSFIAYLDDTDVMSRATIDGLKVSWSQGDEIMVSGSIFVANVDSEDPTKAVFTLKEGQSAPTASTLRAYYPSSAFVSTTYTARYKLQGTVTYNGNDVSSLNYMYAQTPQGDDELHFKNVCGLLAFDLVGKETVKSIKITAPTSNYLYGTISNLAYNESTGAISYSSFTTSGRGTSVTLNCGAEGVQLDESEAKRFYIPVPEKTYASLKIEIICASGKTKTINSTKACPVVKNKIFALPKITVDFPVLTFNASVSVTDIKTTSAAASEAKLNITPTDKDQYYVFAVESPAYVGNFSTPLELAQADIDFWKGQGATSLQMLINAGIAVKGDFSEVQNLKPNSSYVPYAYAIDADFNVSPAVIGEQFTTPEYVLPEASATYNDYLGQWVLGTDLITISEKVAGLTYNISGLSYQSYPDFGYENAPVEATFNKGHIQLAEQVTGTEVSVGSYGACDIVLSGEFTFGGTKYKYYPFNGDEPQVIFIGTFDGNKTIEVEPGTCPHGAFNGFCFAWVIKTGANAGKGNYFTTTALSNMTKYEELTGSTPEGQWLCASVTDYWGEETYTNWTWTIEKSGVGFKINNFDQGFDEFLETQVSGLRSTAPVAVWDADAKTLTVPSKTTTGISAGENLYWTGLNDNTETDIVIQFDFDNNTCKIVTQLWGAYLPDATDPGFYTLYNGPDNIYTKVTSSEAPKANTVLTYGGEVTKVAVQQQISKHAQPQVEKHDVNARINSNLKVSQAENGGLMKKVAKF